jgi:hypothetical protein
MRRTLQNWRLPGPFALIQGWRSASPSFLSVGYEASEPKTLVQAPMSIGGVRRPAPAPNGRSDERRRFVRELVEARIAVFEVCARQTQPQLVGPALRRPVEYRKRLTVRLCQMQGIGEVQTSAMAGSYGYWLE